MHRKRLHHLIDLIAQIDLAVLTFQFGKTPPLSSVPQELLDCS